MNKASTFLLLITTIKSIIKDLRKEFQVENITPEQFGMLKMISEKDEFIQSELANMLDKDKSAIMRQIDILEVRGLLQRVADAADRRKKFLVVTPDGEKLIGRCSEIVQILMDEREKNIEESDLEVFRRVLEQLKQGKEE